MINKRITASRTYANLTQDALAKAIKVGKRTLADYEKGVSEPKASTVVDIAENCKVDTNWLLTGKGEMLLSKTDTPNEEYKQLEDTLMEKLTAQVIKEELDNYLSEEEAEIIKKFRKLPDNLKKAHQLELDRDLLDEQSKALRKKRVNTPIDSPTDTNAIA